MLSLWTPFSPQEFYAEIDQNIAWKFRSRPNIQVRSFLVSCRAGILPRPKTFQNILIPPTLVCQNRVQCVVYFHIKFSLIYLPCQLLADIAHVFDKNAENPNNFPKQQQNIEIKIVKMSSDRYDTQTLFCLELLFGHLACGKIDKTVAWNGPNKVSVFETLQNCQTNCLQIDIFTGEVYLALRSGKKWTLLFSFPGGHFAQ